MAGAVLGDVALQTANPAGFQGPVGLLGSGEVFVPPNQCWLLSLGVKYEGCNCLTISCRTFCTSLSSEVDVVVSGARGRAGCNFLTSSWMAWGTLSFMAGLVVDGVKMEMPSS